MNRRGVNDSYFSFGEPSPKGYGHVLSLLVPAFDLHSVAKVTNSSIVGKFS